MRSRLLTRSGIALPLVLLCTGVQPALAAPEQAGNARCTITGTPSRDFLAGTPARDVLCGRGGDDVIEGRGGNDLVLGGRGDDDVVLGDPNTGGGNDVVRAGAGNDRVSAQTGSDAVHGGGGKDELDGGGDRDRVWGDGGDDRLSGGPDKVRDRLDGGSGRDRATAGPRDLVRGARVASPGQCFSGHASGICGVTTNDTSGDVTAARVLEGQIGCPIRPTDLSAGEQDTWQCAGCALSYETCSYFYTTPDGSQFQMTTHMPYSGWYDPFLECMYASGPAQYTCSPDFTGTFDQPTGTIALQSSSTSDPGAIGAGQSCSDPADSAASDCPTIGQAQAANSSDITFQNTGQAEAGIFLTKYGSQNPYTSQIVDPGDSWTIEVDLGVEVSLQNEVINGPTATIMVTNVTSWGHDGN